MMLRTIARLSEDIYEIEHQEELIQTIREGIYNMNQKALVNKYIIRLFERYPCQHEYVVLANSGLTNNFEYQDNEGKVEICGMSIEYGPNKGVNYTEDIISVDFMKGKNNISDAINYVKKSGLYVDTDTNVCYFMISKDIISDGTITINDADRVNRILSKCILYKGYSWSNSEERNLRATMVNATKYDAKARLDKLDNQLGGSLKYWLERSLDFNSIQKLATRNGLQNPGALYLGELGNDDWGVLIIKKKIEGNSDTTDIYQKYLEDRGINLDNFIIDGQHIKNARWLVDVLEKHHNIITTEEVVAGIMEQERSVGIGNKSAGVYEYQDVFYEMLNYLEENYEYEIIGNPDNIAVIHDKNSAKIPNFNGKNFKSMILEIATASDYAYTSGQGLSKLMAIDLEATCSFLYEQMRNNLIDLTDSTIEDSEYSETGSVSQTLFGLNKDMASTDFYAISTLGKDMLKFMKSAVNKMRVKVKGGSYRAQFENTFMLMHDVDARILKSTKDGYIECYNRDVIEKNRKEIRAINKQYKENLKVMTKEEAIKIRTAALDKIIVGMALKFPCPGKSEFELFRFLTLEELAERIYALKIKRNIADKIYKYFSCRSGGGIILANENILKHKLAGMDTDFDGISIILEPKLVNIARKAYADKSITHTAFPSYTVILNKTKKTDAAYKAVENCVSMIHKQDFDKEVYCAKLHNQIIE